MPRLRRPVDPQVERELRNRQSDLTALTAHPSWPTFELEVQLKEERIKKLVLAKVLSQPPTYTPDELAFMRGFIAGMRWLVVQPPSAERSLEKFLREQGIAIQREEAVSAAGQ